METVHPIPTNGKPAPEHIDWMTGEEVFYPDEPDFVPDEPDFEGPTEQEEREGAEICATMRLDSFMPRHPSFKVFLAEQARQAAIRTDDPNFEWLSKHLAELAARAMFIRARTPAQYDERCEAMSGASEALHAVAWIRRVAGMLESPFRALVPELERAADTLEQFIKPMS